MHLSGIDNAHGELASESVYSNILCCDFSLGSSSCIDENNDGIYENKIIGLFSPTTCSNFIR